MIQMLYNTVVVFAIHQLIKIKKNKDDTSELFYKIDTDSQN